jgi:hypothetical protein
MSNVRGKCDEATEVRRSNFISCGEETFLLLSRSTRLKR